MKKILLLIFLVLFTFDEAFSAIAIVSLLPNPIGDDTLGEYIELENGSCALIDISHFLLSDSSGKSYLIPEATRISAHEKKQFPYSETKITLNNSGEETVTLKDKDGNILDTFSYSGTQKENIVLSASLLEETCVIGEENTGSLSSSGEIFDSGSLTHTGTIFSSGESFTGYLDSEIYSSSTSSTGNTLQDTGTILSDTGILENSSGATNSGNILEIQTGSTIDSGSSGTISSSGNLLPEWLYYDDTDNNGKIDTLEIIYNSFLTGAINLSQIFLYSKSGGLTNAKIDTATGYFVSGSLSGNILILKMQEGDIEKLTLKINNTVSSDLRMKSIGSLGITSLDGKAVESFYLTASFGSYKNVSSKGVQVSTLSSTGVTNSGSNSTIETSSGMSLTLDLPEIIPKLQSPTNATFSSGTFLCTVADCRINITLESLFSSGILQKDFNCSFATGTNLFLEDSDCNPSTYYFSESGSITIEITSRRDGRKYSRDFPVIFFLQNTLKNVQNTPLENAMVDTGKPVAILTLDGKWKEYYEQLGDYEMNCYTFTCSMNFTAEKSYDPEGSKIHFLWIYGRNEIKTTKDPGAIHYELGDHRLILRVIDQAGNYDEIIYITHVLGPKPKAVKDKMEIKNVKASLKKISKEVKSVKKKFKKIKMEFFSLPLLVLQGKTGQKIQEGKYKCTMSRAKTCSLNFAISGSLSSFEYRWYRDGVLTFQGKNPPAWKFKPGNHSLSLETYTKGGTLALSKQTFTISVVTLSKKTKKSVKTSKKTKKPPKKSLSIVPIASAMNIDNQESKSGDTPLAFFILILGLGSGYLLRSKNKRNHSS